MIDDLNEADVIERADRLIDDECDDYLRVKMREGKTRGDFAAVAGNIASDRYGAGSTAARCAVYILLTHGLQMALDFVADLEHHES